MWGNNRRGVLKSSPPSGPVEKKTSFLPVKYTVCSVLLPFFSKVFFSYFESNDDNKWVTLWYTTLVALRCCCYWIHESKWYKTCRGTDWLLGKRWLTLIRETANNNSNKINNVEWRILETQTLEWWNRSVVLKRRARWWSHQSIGLAWEIDWLSLNVLQPMRWHHPHHRHRAATFASVTFDWRARRGHKEPRKIAIISISAVAHWSQGWRTFVSSYGFGLWRPEFHLRELWAGVGVAIA